MLVNILPTDFGLQGTAGAAIKSVVAAKALLSGRVRNSGHFAKVRVAGSSSVVRSKEVQVMHFPLLSVAAGTSRAPR